MMDCWCVAPGRRPSFVDLINKCQLLMDESDNKVFNCFKKRTEGNKRTGGEIKLQLDVNYEIYVQAVALDPN